VVLAAMPLLAGCGSFWQDPYTSTGGTGTTTATSGNFYVVNVETKQIAGFYVNAGTLTELTGSPYTLVAAPLAITVAPNNAFLYVSTINGIYVYTIASSGALTLGNSSSPISSDPAASMQVDATNSWLVEAVSGSPTLYAVAISPTTGATTSTIEQHATLPASTIQQVAISPDNTYAFVAMGSGGTATVPFNAANTNPLGTAGNIALKNSAGAALSVAVDPTNRLLYVGETVATTGTNTGGLRTGGLRVFDFPAFTELANSPYAISGLAPYSILPISTGDYVYVVNRQVSGSSTGVIAGFSITDTSGVYSLTALGSTFTVGTNPVALAEDNTGAFIFAVDYAGSPDLKGYVFDTTNVGYLDAVVSESTGTDPVQASAIAAMH
jgi:6-phosphogluconolactonase (cycloisomerase 2 family)